MQIRTSNTVYNYILLPGTVLNYVGCQLVFVQFKLTYFTSELGTQQFFFTIDTPTI